MKISLVKQTHNMPDREIIQWEIDVTDSKLTKCKKAKVNDLIEEHKDAFNICDQISIYKTIGRCKLKIA